MDEISIDAPDIKKQLSGSESKPLYKALMNDWRKSECPDELPDEEDKQYDIEITKTSLDQYDFRITSCEDENVGMGLYIEINRGVPCIHITDNPLGDNMLHIYAKEQGIVIQKEYFVKTEDFPGLHDAVVFHRVD